MIIISYWRIALTCLLWTLAATVFPWQEEPRPAGESGAACAAEPAYQPGRTVLAGCGQMIKVAPARPGVTAVAAAVNSSN
jgi:hypothetical protein